MRNNSFHEAVVVPQQAFPKFIKLEQVLIEKLEEVQRNLDNELDEISRNDSVQILPPARNIIRRILLNAQIKLGELARPYANSNQLLHFYRDINQFVCSVDEMEMMFCQTLKNCIPKKEVSEEDVILLGEAAPDSDLLSEKTVEALFAEFSATNCKDNFLANHSDMIAQIERVGRLSGDIYAASSTIMDNNSEAPMFLERFYGARSIVSEAIEKIHYAIHLPVLESNQHAGSASRRRGREASSSEECCYEFGLISLCSDIKRQMRQLLKKNNEAQAKRINILKMICSIAGKQPELASPANSSSSCASSNSSCSASSSDSSDSDLSRASSSSCGLFSRSASRSPEQRDPSPPSAGAGAAV